MTASANVRKTSSKAAMSVTDSVDLNELFERVMVNQQEVLRIFQDAGATADDLRQRAMEMAENAMNARHDRWQAALTSMTQGELVRQPDKLAQAMMDVMMAESQATCALMAASQKLAVEMIETLYLAPVRRITELSKPN